MVASKKHPINRGPMISLLGTMTNPNLSEAVGVLKWCLELNPSVSNDQLRGCLETIRFVSR
eukprot:3927175-Alexandrium_andersonii.AAC.1